jgi:AraC-like DNA-binding protein
MDFSVLRFSNGVSDTSTWEMADAAVSPAFSTAVNRMCGFAEDATEPVRRDELPGPTCVLIFSFGAPYRLEDDRPGAGSSLTPRFGFVAGLSEHVTVDVAHGSARCVQVDLNPMGLYRLLGIPMSELANRVIPLDDVMGRLAEQMSDRLEGAGTWERRLEIVQSELASRFHNAPDADPRINWAWRQLSQAHGAIEIGALADELEISHKHFIDLFHHHIGLTPKRAARLLRFRRAVNLVSRKACSNWADLAQAAGYFDQAHFINDVRRYTGRTPSDLFVSVLEGADSESLVEVR